LSDNCHPEFISGSFYFFPKMLKRVQHVNMKNLCPQKY
jgi:hypothetical protein